MIKFKNGGRHHHDQCPTILHKLNNIVKRMIFQFPMVGSPFEADVQLVHMEKSGKIDLIISDDGDLIVLGAGLLVGDVKFDFNMPQETMC